MTHARKPLAAAPGLSNTGNGLGRGDENAPLGTRLTRSKAAASLTGDQKQFTLTGNTGGAVPASRKRAALGDVSNVNKDKQDPAKSGRIIKPLATVNARNRVPARASSAVLKEPRNGPRAQQDLAKSDTKATEALKKKVAVTLEEAAIIAEENKENINKVENARVEASAHRAKKVKKEEARGVEWDDLDAEDADDPLMVAEYVVEIFEYMKKLEISTMPSPTYMEHQNDLKWDMRGVLVDWLIEVHTKFRLYAETLFIAVNIIDRFLTLRVVSVQKLQLVGITALILASKYEEVQVPSIQNFIYMADGGYTDDEILKAERYVLQTLDFNLAYPTPMNFLRRISKADNYDIQTRTVAKYLMEISLLDHHFLQFPPSLIAAAALYASRDMLERGAWDANLTHYSGGYTEAQILPVFDCMINYLIDEVKHEAFFKKYASKKFLKGMKLQPTLHANH